MFDVMKNKRIFFGFSILLFVVGTISMLTVGFNEDIDFAGGTTMYINIGQQYDNNEISSIVKETLGKEPSAVQKSGADGTEVVVKILSLETDERTKLFDAIKTKYNLEQEALLSVDNVNPTVGKELQQSSLWAVLIATLLMLIYISFRFEFKSGVAAIVALLHDTLFVLGFYSLFGLPINLTFIAAILTITGYSINDTIVIFDRIRENTRVMKKTPFSEVVNTSIWQTMSRSVFTALTTLLTITVLYFVGVPSVKEFALPIIVGILMGTYSSIFIASPVWALLRGEGKYKKIA